MSRVASLSILGLLAQVQLGNSAIIPRASPDLGDCSNPTIDYVKDQDGMQGYGYKTANQANFPHGASQDIRAITDYVCSNIQNVCRAPPASYELCKVAAAATDGKTEQAAADAFNNVINASSEAPAPQPSAVDPSQPEAPQITVQPNLNIKFSKDTVVFDDHIDPIWWFNEYLKADGTPALCDESPHRMPDKHFLTFSCEGADERIVPMMKAALIAVVQATIDNTTASDEERMFKHTEEYCHGVGRGGDCPGKGGPAGWYKETVFPQAVHIAVSINIPGSGGALSGNLRYEITTPMSNNCKMCSYLSSVGGTGGAAATKVVEVLAETSKLWAPGVALGSALVSLACLTAC